MTSRKVQRRGQKAMNESPWYVNSKPSRAASYGCGSKMIAPFLALAVIWVAVR